MANSSDDTIRSFCNGCQQETWHKEVGSHSRKRSEDDGQSPRIVDEQWLMLQCCGCESLKVFVLEESIDFKIPIETHYPAKQIRQMPKWCDQVPPKCQDLIREIYMAMHVDCVTLSALGTRTIVDLILSEMFGDEGNFKERLQKATQKGYFTEEQKDIIYVAVDAGSAAAHRGFRPTKKQLDDVLDIVEHALISQYVLAESAGRLKSGVPQRGSSEV